jgi:hypothetical protein
MRATAPAIHKTYNTYSTGNTGYIGYKRYAGDTHYTGNKKPAFAGFLDVCL